MPRREKPALSPLENAVMHVLWERGAATADDVRTALAAAISTGQPLKDSTVRTILRRLEAKGYAAHTSDGRTYVYSPRIDSRRVAADAVRGIIDRFCEGSVENLLVGMVDGELVSPQKLKQLADRIGRAEAGQKPKGSTKRR
jgi:BlaI family transcriptional regulator, penicillinase repressor